MNMFACVEDFCNSNILEIWI